MVLRNRPLEIAPMLFHDTLHYLLDLFLIDRLADVQ